MNAPSARRSCRLQGAAVLALAALLTACGGSGDQTAEVLQAPVGAPPGAVPPEREPVWQAAASAGPDSEQVNNGQRKQGRSLTMRKAPPGEQARTKGRGDGAGCLVEYGRPGQCLPVVPPGHADHAAQGHVVPWTCAEVREYFPSGLPVRKKDRDPQALDSNGDGTACGGTDS